MERHVLSCLSLSPEPGSGRVVRWLRNGTPSVLSGKCENQLLSTSTCDCGQGGQVGEERNSPRSLRSGKLKGQRHIAARGGWERSPIASISPYL
ncbi:hypothetical protein J6590_002061 [Homalodisca vitripennis]|nr:hypothetical protein J6590_002061 [Homalodisca vitripennis]